MFNKVIRYRFSDKFKKSIIVGLVFLTVLLVNPSTFNNIIYKEERLNNFKDFYQNDQSLLNSNGESILFEGSESSLIINDSGNLYDFNQEVSVSNQIETNVSYYLDDIHEWKASKIQTSIKNIYDTREWVQNNDFYELDTPYRNYTSFQNIDPSGFPPHNYSDDLNSDPSNPSNIHSTIYQKSANAIRLHFSIIEIETDWDLLYIYDANNVLQFAFTGKATDLYTPWIKSDTLKITINSDGLIEWYGYDIDYFEYYNSSSGYFDYSNSWGYNNKSLTGNFGPGNISDNSAMYVSLIGNPYRDGDMGATYYEDDFAEIYQNLTIPRGSVIDAYINFDYYAEYAMDSNENFIYCEINNKRIFSKGLGDIVDAGRGVWHSSGNINIDLWSNTSAIFNNIQENFIFNISVGIMSGASVSYSGFDDRFQQFFWFDNVSLTLTTLCNSTQSDINITFNGENLIDNNQWGQSFLNFTGIWTSDPIILTIETSSPSLIFDLDTTIYGYHETTSRVGQTTQEGVFYQILENGSIYWEFTHNFYMPSQYFDFEFEILKPVNWKIISVLDPTFQPRTFEGGNEGDKFLKINKTNAIFPGWWTFRATSPNYLNISNTKTANNGQWRVSKFSTGDSIRIKSQVNFSEEIPPNIGSTSADLNIYYPNGTLCYQESNAPYANGTVFFSSIIFTPQDFIGGQYNYTLFWSNGTALGGLKSSFTLIHNNAMSIIKPDDAVSDFTTEAFIGDIIPLRIQLKDIENNEAITGALINYNWTTGLQIIPEAASGIYETILDTSELISNGFYEIFINSSKIGFKRYNMTLKIDLLEETHLLRLDSEYNIELHDNSTIKYSYTDSTSNGIIGATVEVNLDSIYYSVTDQNDGNYTIEFDTSYINDLGIYQIKINFSAPAFEIQNAIFQFEIIKQSVDISVYINSQEIQENSLIEAMFKENVNISARVLAQVDNEYLSGGNITWNSNNYYMSINKVGNAWYNDTIPMSSTNFSAGLNYVYIRFEQENYQIKNFGFQLLISEQTVNISTFINNEEIAEYSIKQLTFKEEINMSVRVFANGEQVFLSGANITFISDNYNKDIPETAFPWYNTSIEILGSYFNPGINYAYIQFQLENYTTDVFSFQLLISEQTVNISTFIDNNEIAEYSIKELAFKEEINISVRVFANGEHVFLSGANITFISDNYNKDIPETTFPWYNTSIVISASYFNPGINYMYIRFEKENYQIKNFGFQLLISEQTVNISTFINNEEITEYSVKELTFKEEINISATVFANSEQIFLSGANITFISDNYNKGIPETIFPWYNTSIEISGALFNPGINYVYLKFQLENYTTTVFSFQFLIRAQKLNLTVLINSDEIVENSLLELSFNDEFSISAQSYALSEKIYLEYGLMTFVASDYEKNFTGYVNYWYNTSISCSPNIFSLGVNYVFLRFQKENYSTTIFSFQILVNQIELQVNTIGFEDSIEVEIGDSVLIQIELIDPITNISIENAIVSYSWEYGIGTLNETTPGTYQTVIDLPENLQGDFKFTLIITPEDSIYKTFQDSFIMFIKAPIIDNPVIPNYLLWIIIGVLISIASVLGVLSLRSYVILPRKRRREAELLSKTQKFKDLKNIQAIVVIHKFSGIPIYSKSYSILEKHKKELFSGFIQAITMIGEEFTEEKTSEPESLETGHGYGVEKMMELDFKQFYCLIADIEAIRTVFILKERSSERLKSQVSNLILALNLKLSDELENWDGSLDEFEKTVPQIINEYFELYYKDSFRLSDDINLILIKKEKKLSKMEMRVINVIQSMSEENKIPDLNNIVQLVSEENKDLVIEAIESLLNQNLIIPSNN
ncbi:MAG: hypothetical protein ACFFCV_09025 [Promethearchaeota archaeon]